jgi:hypothetical protein
LLQIDGKLPGIAGSLGPIAKPLGHSSCLRKPQALEISPDRAGKGCKNMTGMLNCIAEAQ